MTKESMNIDVARLRPEGERFFGEEPASIMELEKDPTVRIESPVRYDVRAQLLSRRKILVEGAIAVDVAYICARCAEPFRETVSEPSFQGYFETAGETESVDLTPHIREAILLRFLSNPLCRPTCRGLCPQCGANLNNGRCGCAPTSPDKRWNVLDDLDLKQRGAENGSSKKKDVEA